MFHPYGLSMMWTVFLMGVLLVPLVFYILTLRRALHLCAPESRAMSPDSTWLLLIPLFNVVWHFYVVTSVGRTLHNEFEKRGIRETARPGQALGLLTSVLWLLTWVPFLRILALLAGLVCWVLYWIKIGDYSAKLAQPAPSSPPPAPAP